MARNGQSLLQQSTGALSQLAGHQPAWIAVKNVAGG
jgi:hypothetical protein